MFNERTERDTGGVPISQAFTVRGEREIEKWRKNIGKTHVSHVDDPECRNLICPDCDEGLEEHWNYCPSCGDDLSELGRGQFEVTWRVAEVAPVFLPDRDRGHAPEYEVRLVALRVTDRDGAVLRELDPVIVETHLHQLNLLEVAA